MWERVTVSNCYGRHRHQGFLRFLNDIDGDLPRGFDVHLIIDNYGTHRVSKVQTWLARHPRYHVHFTPTSASWLDLVERLFAELTDRCVRRGSHTAVRTLEKAMLEYLDQQNRDPKPFVWTADADLILGQNGKRLGRPLSAGLQATEIRKLFRAGVAKAEIARRLQIGRTSVRRILKSNGHEPNLPGFAPAECPARIQKRS